MNRYDVMLSYVPLYYQTSAIFKAILVAEGTEFDLLRQNIEDLTGQFFVDTAVWGLEYWEKEYGLPVNTRLTDEERRSRLIAKIRGMGKVDSELIESVASAYSNGEVSVSFDSRIKVKFIGTRGIPEELEELKKQINDIIPAHVAVEYEFTYLTWGEFDLLTAETQESMTWAELEAFRPFDGDFLTWDELDYMIPQLQESMTWDELETYSYGEGV